MSAFFFGRADRQLFGYHHAATGAANSAVVLCPAWGPEYQYAHRAFRSLARRLSERGVHALRFDYSGTGDSWGDTTEADTGVWLEDIALAVDELKAISSVSRIDLIGLRYGAHLAASAASARNDIRRVALWDPVIEGSDWTRQLGGELVANRPTEDREMLEFSNRLVSTQLVDQFRAVRAPSYPVDIAEEVLILQTTPGGAGNPLPHVRNARFRMLEDVTPWVEDASIWSGLVPAKAVSTLADWLVS